MKIQRRQFFQAVGLGVGALALRPHRAKAAEGSKGSSFLRGVPQIHLGLVTYNLAQDWDIATIIKNCEATKFEGVELRTTHAHKVEVNLSKDERKEVRKRFADSKVQLMGLGSIFDYHTPDPAKLHHDIEATKEYIILAQDVGATGVKVRPNGLPKEVPVEKTLAQIGNALAELGDFARDHGLVIRLEVHGPGSAFPPYIKTILDTANRPNVGACWNSNATDLDGEGWDHNFNLLKDKILSVHLTDLFLEEYPFRKLVTGLNEVSFKGFCLAEIPASTDPVRVMKYYRALWLAYQNLL
jgi:sugar phosphate isomerase/epimerase